MKRLTKKQDAFGLEIYNHLHGIAGEDIAERNDGWFATTNGLQLYFAPYEQWSTNEQKAIKYVRGRTLDIGCGAGRVCLHLQDKSLDIVGIDNSPLAIKVCKERGVKNAKLMSITEVTRKSLGRFDTIIMYGNNFGLFENFKRARWLLKRFHNATTPHARIIAATTDPYDTNVPEYLAYHRRNRRLGRMSGQLRLRLRYRLAATPWFDYLMVSRDELQKIVTDTGWKIARTINPTGAQYIAILEKETQT